MNWLRFCIYVLTFLALEIQSIALPEEPTAETRIYAAQLPHPPQDDALEESQSYSVKSYQYNKNVNSELTQNGRNVPSSSSQSYHSLDNRHQVRPEARYENDSRSRKTSVFEDQLAHSSRSQPTIPQEGVTFQNSEKNRQISHVNEPQDSALKNRYYTHNNQNDAVQYLSQENEAKTRNHQSHQQEEIAEVHSQSYSTAGLTDSNAKAAKKIPLVLITIQKNKNILPSSKSKTNDNQEYKPSNSYSIPKLNYSSPFSSTYSDVLDSTSNQQTSFSKDKEQNYGQPLTSTDNQETQYNMNTNQKEYASIFQNSRLTGRNSGNTEWRPVDKYGFKLDNGNINLNTQSQDVYRSIEQNSGTKSNSFYLPELRAQQDRQQSINQYSPSNRENKPTDLRQYVSSQSSRHTGGNLVNEGLRNPSSSYTTVISDENNAEIRKRPDSFFRGNINFNEDNSGLYPSVRNQNYQQNLTTTGRRSQPNTAANIRYEEVSPNAAQLSNEAFSYTSSSIQSLNGEAHVNSRQSTHIPQTYNYESPKHAIQKNFEENRANFDGSGVLNTDNQNFRKLSGTHEIVTNRHPQNSKYQTVKEATVADVNHPINQNYPRTEEKRQINNNGKSTVSNYSPLQHQNFNQDASTFHSQDKLYSSFSSSVQQSKPTGYKHEQSITYSLSDGPVNTKLQQTDVYVTNGNKQHPEIHYTSAEPSLSSNKNFRETPRNTQAYVSSKNVYEDQKRDNEDFQANVNPRGGHTDLRFQIADQKKQVFSQSREQVTFPRNNPVWDDQERIQLESNHKNIGNEPQYRTYHAQEKTDEQLSYTRPTLSSNQNVNLNQNNQKQEFSTDKVLIYDEKPTSSQNPVHSAQIHQSRNFLGHREFDGNKQYSSEGKRENFVSYDRSSAISSGQKPVNQYNNENSGTTRNYNLNQNQNSNLNYRSQSQQSFNENYKPAIDLPTHISDESSHKSSSSNFDIPFENTQNVNYRLSGTRNGFISTNQEERFEESTARQNLQSQNQASNYKSSYSPQTQPQQENAYKSSSTTNTVKNTLNASSSSNRRKQEKNSGNSYGYGPSRNTDSSLTSDNSDSSDKRVAVKEVSRDEIQKKSSAPEALLLVLVSAKRSALEDLSSEPDGTDLNEGYESSPEELVDFLSEGSNAKMILDSFHEATNGAYRQLEDENVKTHDIESDESDVDKH
ncbi:GATA zinc finger domain-containing protein 14-like [Stegodyphus dumicola]|uniref:GATA zinc finger domain-containing protein 14-like n=1 Tax=Stegodyphus dumicola TaxID=202533 RepID=UPI0015ACFEAF|nr:GATA zinc finger domain-containing protein 14-like [Stegodyphus dumicola]